MLKKRFTSLFLALAMVLGLSGQAFAANDVNEHVVAETVEALTDGYAYSYLSDAKSVVILVDGNQSAIDVGITYLDEPHLVHQLSFGEDFLSRDVRSFSTKDWHDLMDEAESRITSGTTVTMRYEDIDSVPYAVAAGNSPEEDLKDQLQTIMGGGEYQDVLRYSTTYKGLKMRIYTSSHFRIEKKLFTWNQALTIAGIASGVLALFDMPIAIEVICSVLGVATGVTQLVIPNGNLHVYRCRTMVDHSTRINDMTYIYNITWKFIDYIGLWNPDEYASRAQLDQTSRTVSYPDGEAYFNSNSSQIEDAYRTYQQIGAKP